EEAHIPLMLTHMVGAPAMLDREALRQPHDFDGERTRQEAGLERKDPVEAAALMKPKHGTPVLADIEAELHLVAIVKSLIGRLDRQHRGVPKASYTRQCLAHLLLLDLALGGIIQVLKPAAATARNMRAGWFDAQWGWAFDPLEMSLGVAPLDAGDLDLELVIRQSAIDEHDQPFMSRHCLATEG